MDETGILTLRFNMILENIKNLTYIDNQIIKLDIFNSKNDLSRNLNITWYAINFTDRDLKI